jgi:hypothetical protein
MQNTDATRPLCIHVNERINMFWREIVFQVNLLNVIDLVDFCPIVISAVYFCCRRSGISY